MSNWDSGVKDAKKVPGDKAKIPDYPRYIPKSLREQLKKALVATEEEYDSTMENFEQFQDKIDGEGN